ncbi:MAG: DnaD domain protein, partial [Oscillospiraceae bacterium]
MKVLLLALRKNDFTTATIADILKISDSDVVDSFNYWADAGVLISTENVKIADPIVPKKAVKKQITKPSREEVTRRGFESPEVVFLLREAELKFGRALRQTEASTLLWLFDDEGMDISLILMLLEYAIGEEKINV